MRLLKTLGIALAIVVVMAVPAGAATVTIAPQTPVGAPCFPFGGGTVGWTPTMGFIYQHVPPFTLKAGDTLAFDLTAANDSDIQLAIAMARTTTDGGQEPAEPFVPVVANTAPAPTSGNATADDFDLVFPVAGSFSFPGGGLVIRFSDPAGTFGSNGDCGNGFLRTTTATDTSGYFVGRFFNDPDGMFPWAVYTPDPTLNAKGIGGFRVTYTPNTDPPFVPPDKVKPVISALTLSSSSFKAAGSGPPFTAKAKVGTTVFYSLTEPSSVKFTVQKAAPGRKVGNKCAKPKRSNRRKRKCTRYVGVKGSFTVNGNTGANSFKFRGRIGGKKLKPGSYKLVGVATDPAKNVSAKVVRKFTIVLR